MFALHWAEPASEQFKELQDAAEKALAARRTKGKAKSSKQEGLFKQVFKTIELLKSNPKHPGLQTHEFLSMENPFEKNGKVFEAYAQNKTPNAYRVFWCYGPGKKEITILAITPHP